MQFNFDARTVQPAEPGVPVWDGIVPVQITRTEIKPTAANNGSNMLVLSVQALAGTFTSQVNVIRLNLWNANAQAVDIAQRELSAICHVGNRMTITDTEQLVGAQFLTVWVRETREMTDQQTGAKKQVEGCKCTEYRLIDGRTIREAMTGQPASQPYNSNAAHSQAPQPQPQPQPHQPALPAAGPQMQGQFGGQPTAPQGGFQPPVQQPSTGQFAPPGAAPQTGALAPPGVPAQGQHGGPQTPPAAGFGTAQSGFSPGQHQQPAFQPPGQPQPGSGPWGPQTGQMQR